MGKMETRRHASAVPGPRRTADRFAPDAVQVTVDQVAEAMIEQAYHVYLDAGSCRNCQCRPVARHGLCRPCIDEVENILAQVLLRRPSPRRTPRPAKSAG